MLLSGFFTHWTSRGDVTVLSWQNCVSFWHKRCTRIVLAYEISQCASLLIQGTHEPQLWRFGLNVFMIPPWLMWSQACVSQYYYLVTFNSPGWTISALMFCWFTYPFLKVWCVDRRPPAQLCLSICFCAFCFWEIVVNAGWKNSKKLYLPPVNVPLFMIGVFAAELAALNPVARIYPVVRAAIIDVLIAVFFAVHFTKNSHGHTFMWATLGLLLLALILAAGQESLFFGSSWMYSAIQQVAKYSFHAYIFQHPVAQFFGYGLAKEKAKVVHWYRFPPVLALSYVILLLGVSAVYHQLVETPFMNLFGAKKKKSSGVIAPVGAYQQISADETSPAGADQQVSAGEPGLDGSSSSSSRDLDSVTDKRARARNVNNGPQVVGNPEAGAQDAQKLIYFEIDRIADAA